MTYIPAGNNPSPQEKLITMEGILSEWKDKYILISEEEDTMFQLRTGHNSKSSWLFALAKLIKELQADIDRLRITNMTRSVQ